VLLIARKASASRTTIPIIAEPQSEQSETTERPIFEFTRWCARVSRAPRNLIGYSGRDTLTAQDSMSTSHKAVLREERETERERERERGGARARARIPSSCQVAYRASYDGVLSRLQARGRPPSSPMGGKKTGAKAREYENDSLLLLPPSRAVAITHFSIVLSFSPSHACFDAFIDISLSPATDRDRRNGAYQFDGSSAVHHPRSRESRLIPAYFHSSPDLRPSPPLTSALS